MGDARILTGWRLTGALGILLSVKYFGLDGGSTGLYLDTLKIFALFFEAKTDQGVGRSGFS